MLIEGRVHRATGPWTPGVQALLHHLERIGFDGSPRVCGWDEEGREILTWIDGEAPAMPWPPWMQTDDALDALGRLLRRYHDAVATFTPPPEARWRRWIGSPGGPIIRHGDLWPSNVVFRVALPVALIGWEFAQPGTILDDLASAAKQWVPLLSDERAIDNGWRLPINRVRRLRVLCDSYGLSQADRPMLLPTVLRNAEYGYRSHKMWAEEGVPGFAEMWAAGSGERILGDRAWLRAVEGELQAEFLIR
ncbi:MAG: phosphotransferase [Candidatus Dormibacteraeota bacterium]|nr:phosphotransferase [Candidatus Dormibacteraeota bacterium]